MSIKVILADDHEMMRKGLRSLFEQEIDIEVIAEAENGRKAVELAWELQPDIIIMDVSMPDLNGIEATRQIKKDFPDIKVIALSMYTNERFILEMLKAGVSGYLLKDSAFEELIKAIRTVMLDRVHLSPEVTSIMLNEFMQKAQHKDNTSFSVLTAREREVLQLIAEGNTTKKIASQLNVSVKTVDTHRQHIMEKLDIHNIAELTKYAIRLGLTSLE